MYKNGIFNWTKRYVKGYGFLSFAKKMDRHANKVAKGLSNKYSQKIFDSAKKSTTDAIKTASERAIQKTAETTGDLIGNKIADKITNISKKKSAKEIHNNNETEEDVEINTHKKRYLSPEERQQIISELRLIPKKKYIFFRNIHTHIRKTTNYWWIKAFVII